MVVASAANVAFFVPVVGVVVVVAVAVAVVEIVYVC